MGRKQKNGRWDESFIREVVAFAEENWNAAAIRKYKVPAATFYGWMRNPQYRTTQKKRKAA